MIIGLLSNECRKIVPYRTFWIVMALFAITVPGVFYMLGEVPTIKPMIYGYAKIWHNLAYLASWLNLLCGVLVILLTCNEFTFRTFGQHIIDGQRRTDMVLSKVLLIFLIASLCTVYFDIKWCGVWAC